METLFRVKICGVTSPADAEVVAAAGADAIGLNFFPRSPRYVADRAAEIAAAIPPGVWRVGVFVNRSPSEILEIAHAVKLDAIQLHGDEPAQLLARLAPYPVIRVFRCGKDGLRPSREYLRQCAASGRLPAAVLVDAFQPGSYGGTGELADWNAVRRAVDELSDLPVILAGGLTPDNVAAAIVTARPAGVDAASGVESQPGVKDPARVRVFVQRALQALLEDVAHFAVLAEKPPA